jgi:hypothetical protein
VKVVAGSACASPDPLDEHSNLALKTVPATDLESTVSDDGHTTQAYAIFTFVKAGTYTVCYRLAGKEYEKMATPLVIKTVNPTKFYTDPEHSSRLTSPTKYTFTLNTSSTGLDLTAAGDKAKVVFGTDCLTDPVADGNSIVADLGPSDAVDATSASFEAEFITAGEHTVCYKNTNNGSVFEKVGDSFVVKAVQPVRTSPSSAKTNTTYLFSLSGGSGLDARSGKDRVVVVPSTTSCSDVTVESHVESVIEALTGQAMSATKVGFNHSFEKPGSYRVCYKLNASASFSEVTPNGQIIVGATTPTAYTIDGEEKSESNNTIVLTGGSGLNASAGGDALKLVELVSAGSLATPSDVQAYLDTLGCSEAAHATVASGPNPVTHLDVVDSGRTVAC